jgi:hypothetical protein
VTGRALFMIIAAALIVLVLFTAVARPAVERGGWGELGIVAVSMLAILLVERWLRSR